MKRPADMHGSGQQAQKDLVIECEEDVHTTQGVSERVRMHKFYWSNVAGSSRSVHSGEGGDRPPYPPYPGVRGYTPSEQHYQVQEMKIIVSD